MFIQQDWLMRQIEMTVSMVLRLFLRESPQDAALPDEFHQQGTEELAGRLSALLRQGRLGKAEDLLFERLDPEDKSIFVTAMDFYRQANVLTDEELAAQDFTREELLEGLSQVVKRYGLDLPNVLDNP